QPETSTTTARSAQAASFALPKRRLRVISNRKVLQVDRPREILLRACGAIQSNETLSNDSDQCRSEDASVDSEFREPQYRRNCIGCMKRGQDQMSGHGGMKRGDSGIGIANLPDENHIGILSQDRSQRPRECQSGLFVYGNLAD